MGCIVNGPGEMADADFGYVGGAPGKIDLYVGKVCGACCATNCIQSYCSLSWKIRICLLLGLVPYDFPMVVLHTKVITSSHLWFMSGGSIEQYSILVHQG